MSAKPPLVKARTRFRVSAPGSPGGGWWARVGGGGGGGAWRGLGAARPPVVTGREEGGEVVSTRERVRAGPGGAEWLRGVAGPIYGRPVPFEPASDVLR